MRHRKKSCVDRHGLVLLIVLGMIAMFSLLAVTYVVLSGDSRDASRAVLRGERQRNFDLDAVGRSVLTNMVVGTNDQQSPFYQQDILGDVYGRDSFVTRGHVFGAPPSWQLMANPAITATTTRLPDFCMVKLTLNPTAENGFPLSQFENEYNSRILTVLEGPLTGQSFRIIKYIGHVNPVLNAMDPNVDLIGPPIPWTTANYTDPRGAETAYSVVIDLTEIKGERFTGSYFPPSSTEETSITLSAVEWIQRFGVESLFYKPRPIATAPYEGFRLLINGAPFNSVGIGIEEIAQLPLPSPFVRGFGNIDSRRLMRIPTLPTRKVSPALLPNYDYLNDPFVMNANPLMANEVGVDGVGTTRNNALEFKLRGQSNEGYDVPDYRDHWLAHVTHVNDGNGAWRKWIKPSYHQPAVIQYLAHLFGNPASLSLPEQVELFKLVDMSTSRVLSYGNVNPNFMSREPDYPRLPPNPTPVQMQQYMLSQITGLWGGPLRTDRSWDIDNDGDGRGDAVWMDPRLPVVYGPEGQRLKPLVAITTVDLDGRVNLNAAGDRVEALNPMFPQAITQGFKQAVPLLPAGFGYGPKEISLARLLSNAASGPTGPGDVNPVLRSDNTRYSFFDELYGARRSPTFGRFPIDFTSFATDRSPGRRAADDHFPLHRHREVFTNSTTLPGMPIGRRGSIGLSFDRNGNPAWVQRTGTDVLPTNPLADVSASETLDDGYEFAPSGKPSADDPFNLTELETILRRYDADAASLPPRIRDLFTRAGFTDINNHIYEAVTTRSGELRYPNLGAALATTVGTDLVALHETPSMLKYLQWLHSQRYRFRGSSDPLLHDPEISYAALTELFSTDFSAGLRMDLNRPFGDGIDNDAPLGQIDDPLELQTMPQVEDIAGTPGDYTREIYLSATKPSPPSNFPSTTRLRLGSRQVLARHLYCLAQLIVPKQHEFPEMNGINAAITDPVERNLRRAEIRARNIAQWAINVVDFRDADATMSRFEYDIFPFGLGPQTATQSGLAPRPAYWAPDHVGESVNGIPNKRYIGVVWGMEMPELVLSETLALHDKRVRDTDMDANNQLAMPNGTDPDFDQYRFPQASLFIELKAVRTAANNEMFVPGVSRLHRLVNGEMHLDLSAMAPASPRWGQQPVWRIAISQDYHTIGTTTADRPIAQNTANLQRTTHQFAFERPGGFPTSLGNGDITSAGTIEEYIGSGLIYDVMNPSAPGPTATVLPETRGFERFVWFTSMDPTTDIPDIVPAIRTAGLQSQIASVYRARGNSLTDNSHLLRGGEFLVVAPRLETPIGSLTHHPFEPNFLFPPALRRTDMASDPRNRPVHAPSRQRISLTPDVTLPFEHPTPVGNRTIRTYSFNGEQVNQLWWERSRRPKAMVCAVPTLDDPATQNYFDNQNGTDWDLPFPNGIGLNISYPTPVHSDTYSLTDYWHRSHRPIVRLNTDDELGGGTPDPRPDGTLGFGNDDYLVANPNGLFLPPDSWVNVVNPTTNFPDRPFDRDNPYIGGAGRYLSQTYENVRTAYLQRLADPDFAYDPYSNPYITVDWMPIDLTVFNGEANPSSDPIEGSLTSGAWSFQSRYKDGRLTPGIADSASLGRQTGISVYAPNTPVLRTTRPQTPPPPAPASAEYPNGLNHESYFTHALGYDTAIGWVGGPYVSGTTLGYTNVGYHNINPSTPLRVADATDANVDGFGIPLPPSGNDAFLGATNSLQGLFWSNRPFASPYEIMMVPATSPGNFGLYHSGYVGNERKGFAFLPSFQANNAWNFNYPSDDHRQSYWAIPDVINTTNFEADWGLILDFIETKPPFIDAEKKLDPATVYQIFEFGASPASQAALTARRFLNSFIPQGYYGTNSPSRVRGPTLLAPFNSLPTFVAAGKVNINTLTFGADGRSKSLEAIEQHYLRGTDVGAAFAYSRAGYNTTDTGPGMTNSFFGNKILHFNPNLPTDFAGAFRPAMTSNLGPELHDPAATAAMRGRWNAQAGLLRAADLGANLNATASTQPLTFNSAPAAHGIDVLDGQPYARYQRLMRLPNLVTNQSNVFASWVTISLFEYDPITGFGNEYIDPAGEPIRERYFYIIDRTVPVGYSPGERLNMKRTILLEKKL